MTEFIPPASGVAPSRHPKPGASRKASANSEPYTSSFFGTHPRSTHVPPAPPAVSDATRAYGISQTAALMPGGWWEGGAVGGGRAREEG